MKNVPFQWKSFFTWLLLAATIFLCAFFGNSDAGMMACAFLMLLPVLSFFLNFRIRKKVNISFSMPVTAPKSERCRGTVTVANGSIFPCRKAAATIEIRNMLTGENEYSRVFLTLPSGGSASADFDFSSIHCGRLVFTGADIVLYDWFGFLPLGSRTNSAASVTILPDLFPCEIKIRPVSQDENASDSFEAKKGEMDPSELYALRQYEKGDPLTRVHWKLSAKRETLIVKEISDPVDETLLLVYDKTPAHSAADAAPEKSDSQYAAAAPDDTGRTLTKYAHLRGAAPEAVKLSGAAADAAAEAISSAAFSLCEQGIPFTLAWEDEEGLFSELISSSEELLSALPLMIKNGKQEDSPEFPAFLRRFAKVLWFGQTYPFQYETDLPSDTTCLLVRQAETESPENPPTTSVDHGEAAGDHLTKPTDHGEAAGDHLTISFEPGEEAEVLSYAAF